MKIIAWMFRIMSFERSNSSRRRKCSTLRLKILLACLKGCTRSWIFLKMRSSACRVIRKRWGTTLQMRISPPRIYHKCWRISPISTWSNSHHWRGPASSAISTTLTIPPSSPSDQNRSSTSIRVSTTSPSSLSQLPGWTRSSAIFACCSSITSTCWRPRRWSTSSPRTKRCWSASNSNATSAKIMKRSSAKPSQSWGKPSSKSSSNCWRRSGASVMLMRYPSWSD